MNGEDRTQSRRRWNEREETKSWVHYVADLDSGAVYHFARDRPLTPLSRTNQLARLGHPVGTSILDGPWYKLTPKSPFQTSPQARISLDGNPDYYYDYMTLGGDPAGLITWTVPLEKAHLVSLA